MIIIILGCILVIIYLINLKIKESFSIYWSGGFLPGILPIRHANGIYTNLPNNIQLNKTTNRYNLRGQIYNNKY